MSYETFFAWAVGAVTTIAIISVVLFILSVIAWWKIFKKAGQPGWKSIIPLYNGHVLYSLCWRPVYFWVMFICTAASSFITYFQGVGEPNALLAVLSAVLMIVGVVLSIKFNFKLAKAFGKGAGFGVGLWLLHTIFAYILAFGKAQYVGIPGNKANL